MIGALTASLMSLVGSFLLNMLICLAFVNSRASSGGFVPAPDATPSPEAAGQVGGPGMGAMADVIDAVGGAFTGDGRRVERAVEDLTHDNAGMHMAGIKTGLHDSA